MNYSSIYNQEYDAYINHVNNDFKSFLKLLKDDERNYIQETQRGYISSLKDGLQHVITYCNIKDKEFYAFRNLFLDGKRDYQGGVDNINSAITKNIVPVYKEFKPSFSLENLIKVLATNDATTFLIHNIGITEKKIQHNFKQNQIDKVNITKAPTERKSKKASTVSKESLDIEKRLFLFFLEKKLYDDKLMKRSISEYNTLFDCDVTEYARLVAYSLGINDDNLNNTGKHNKSIIYRYIKEDKFEDQKGDKKFLQGLISDLEGMKLPKVVIESVDLFYEKVK